VSGSYPWLVSGREIAMPGTSPTATPSRQPTAARRNAWAAAITRRVPRVAPSAARVAWSVCCSARVRAVEVRVMTRMSSANTPSRIATTSRSWRSKPRSTCTKTSSPRVCCSFSAASLVTAAPEGSRTVKDCGTVAHPRVVGVSVARRSEALSMRAAESLVCGIETAGTVTSWSTFRSGAMASVAVGSTAYVPRAIRTVPGAAMARGSRTTAPPSRTVLACAVSSPSRRTISSAGSRVAVISL